MSAMVALNLLTDVIGKHMRYAENSQHSLRRSTANLERDFHSGKRAVFKLNTRKHG